MDSCGYTLDYLRVAYNVNVKLGPGCNDEAQLHWYNAPLGAASFPVPHRFASLNWIGREREGDLGERKKILKNTSGTPSGLYQAKNICPNVAAWQEGIGRKADWQYLPINPNTNVAACCGDIGSNFDLTGLTLKAIAITKPHDLTLSSATRFGAVIDLPTEFNGKVRFPLVFRGLISVAGCNPLGYCNLGEGGGVNVPSGMFGQLGPSGWSLNAQEPIYITAGQNVMTIPVGFSGLYLFFGTVPFVMDSLADPTSGYINLQVFKNGLFLGRLFSQTLTFSGISGLAVSHLSVFGFIPVLEGDNFGLWVENQFDKSITTQSASFGLIKIS